MSQILKSKLTIVQEWIGDVMLAEQEQQILEFIALADDIGPFCRLSELSALLQNAPGEVRETTLFHYLRGLFDARCFFDKSRMNDL